MQEGILGHKEVRRELKDIKLHRQAYDWAARASIDIEATLKNAPMERPV